MSYETKTPPAAKELLDSAEGWTYLDVRTEGEFASGHVPGAYNIPFAVHHPTMGMMPNPQFTEVVQRHFEADRALVVGCAAGGRSMAACEALQHVGFTRLVNMHGGFSGAAGPSGEITEPGWSALGYDVERDSPAERTFAELKK